MPTPLTSLRTLITALAVGLLLTGCSRQPREHWWQVWRSNADSTLSDFETLDGDDLLGSPGALPPPRSGHSGPLDVDRLALDPDLNPYETPLPSPQRDDAAMATSQLVPIYFAYDSYELTAAAQQALDANLRWILANPGVRIRIEGHCDARGTDAYNYNLGQERALAVRSHFVQNGVDESRLDVRSWGETRPLNPSESEEAYRQNRRVQFAVWATQ